MGSGGVGEQIEDFELRTVELSLMEGDPVLGLGGER